METKELKIQIPEGYCIDESKSTFEKIVFKKKDTKPRSWEEYCKLMKINKRTSYDILNDSSILVTDWTYMKIPEQWKTVLPSKELAKAFLAMMQLMSLRQDWIHKWSIDNGMVDDWKPNWNDDKTIKSCIDYYKNEIIVSEYYSTSHPLSFPTQEMADDFMSCFKDLLEIARPLI